MKKWLALVVFLFGICLSFRLVNAEIEIDAEFPGGNILVDSIQEDTIRVRPDLRGDRDWFYYAFRVKNAEERTLSFLFDAPNRVGSRGPAVSADGGQTWTYLSGTPNADSRKFTYTFGADETSVLFALAPLYTQKNWDEFIAGYSKRSDVELSALCKSRKGRDVELLRVGKGNSKAKFAVILTCRHHCCEMTASFVLEGMLQEIFSESEYGSYLRENAEFFIVPFTDKDGVEDGDQGKGRKPHDHNRDYHHEIYPEIHALKAQTIQNFGTDSGKKIFFMDLHCPWIRSGMNEYFYSPMSSSQKMTEAAESFFRFFETHQKEAEIPYSVKNNLPFGQGWNTTANYVKLENGIPTAGSKMWFGTLENAIFAGTIEMPYSNSSGVEVTAENARELGRNLSKAAVDFLRQTEK